MTAQGHSAVGLVHPKNVLNVGAALRAADAFGAAMLVVQGKRYKKAPTDVSRAHRRIPLVICDIMSTIPYDCVPVAVELIEGATDLSDYVHPERALYIFGPEDGSVPNRIVKKCRDVVYVPSSICLNLAAIVNVVLYDRAAKQRRAVA